LRAVSTNVRAFGLPSVRVTDGCHSIRAPIAASFAFSPGWSPMKWSARRR
jgi:hypothetical protein